MLKKILKVYCKMKLANQQTECERQYIFASNSLMKDEMRVLRVHFG